MKEPKFWDCEDSDLLIYDDIDEAIVAFLDNAELPLPNKIEVFGFAPVEIRMNNSRVLEDLLDYLDEEYGNPDDGSSTDPTPAMIEAERKFVDTVIREYGEPWTCEVVDTRIIDVREWVEKNRPDWLEDGVTINDD